MADKKRGKFNNQQGSGTNEDETSYGYQQSRKQALANNAGYDPLTARDAGHKLLGNGYNIRQKSDKKSAYRELESLQRSAIADYASWAKETVKYDNLNSENAATNLKQYNDTYTMSMLMGVIAPLENGCSISSVLQCLMSYNVVRIMNPDLDMDSSRMFYNFKNTVAPMVSDLKSDHPILGRLLSPITSNIDGALSEAGGAKLATTIDSHEKVHDIDSMYLTPRQVAALKLNFMEQYYSDLRSTNDEYVRKECTANYNKAMKHLNAICSNGGYDMSVVASEERYLVSLKIQENPNYMTMFSETFDVFGVKIDMNDVAKSQRWTGKFISTDEHDWYGTSDLATNGAFHVRMPMSAESMKKDMLSHAGSFNTMRQYVNSDLFIGGKDDKKALLEEIDRNENQYLERMKFIAKTDRISFPDKIERVYERQQAIAIKEAATNSNEYGVDLTYIDEMQSVTLATVAKKMGYDPDAMRDNERHVFDTESAEYKKMMVGITNYVRDGQANGTIPASMTAERALENIQLNYFDNLDAADQYDILAHVVTNVEQGYKEHQSDRNNVKKEGITRLRDIYPDMGINPAENEQNDDEASPDGFSL